jgi:hypothetical protein
VQAARDTAADTAAGAGYESRLAGKIKHSRILSAIDQTMSPASNRTVEVI